jgi:hypothetical protein
MKRTGILLLAALLLAPVSVLAQAPQPQSGTAKRLSHATPGVTATQILGSDPSRLSALCNNGGSVNVFVGPDATVTASGANVGFPVAAGGNLVVDKAPATPLFGITGSGSATITCLEEIR